MVKRVLKIYSDSKLPKLIEDNLELLGLKKATKREMANCVVYMEMDEKEVQKAFLDGLVPVCPASAKYLDFSPIEEEMGGCVFDFDPKNELSLVDALIRARENFQFPYDWKNILKNGRDR